MNRKIKALTVIFIIGFLLFCVKLFFENRFHSPKAFQEYMQSFGVAGPLVLTLFQALQVVIPILPGYVGCAAGAIGFGPMLGFWCNYIGISAGSIIAYYLARRYGIKIVLALFPQEQYDKWSAKVQNSKSYTLLLFMAILLPLAPDDFLCYFSGLLNMNSKKFIWIIILGKPWCILAYSIGFGLLHAR